VEFDRLEDRIKSLAEHYVGKWFGSVIASSPTEQAATFGVEGVIIGAQQRSRLKYAVKGNVMRGSRRLLPEDIQLSIFGSQYLYLH